MKGQQRAVRQKISVLVVETLDVAAEWRLQKRMEAKRGRSPANPQASVHPHP